MKDFFGASTSLWDNYPKTFDDKGNEVNTKIELRSIF